MKQIQEFGLEMNTAYSSAEMLYYCSHIWHSQLPKLCNFCSTYQNSGVGKDHILIFCFQPLSPSYVGWVTRKISRNWNSGETQLKIPSLSFYWNGTTQLLVLKLPLNWTQNCSNNATRQNFTLSCFVFSWHETRRTIFTAAFIFFSKSFSFCFALHLN